MSDPVVEFLDRHQLERRAYLGDGVYAGHDGDNVWLLTSRSFAGSEHTHWIVLDPKVQHALLTYLRPPPASPGTGDDEEADGATNGD